MIGCSLRGIGDRPCSRGCANALASRVAQTRARCRTDLVQLHARAGSVDWVPFGPSLLRRPFKARGDNQM